MGATQCNRSSGGTSCEVFFFFLRSLLRTLLGACLVNLGYTLVGGSLVGPNAAVAWQLGTVSLPARVELCLPLVSAWSCRRMPSSVKDKT